MDLEISDRDGRPRLGYLYLSDPSEKSTRSRRISAELVIDVNEQGALIGIELLDPENTTIEAINAVLKQHGLDTQVRESGCELSSSSDGLPPSSSTSSPRSWPQADSKPVLVLHCASSNRVGAIWLLHQVLEAGSTKRRPSPKPGRRA